MPKLSQAEKVIEFLKANLHIRFTARQIAKPIVSLHDEDYQQKRQKKLRLAMNRSFFREILL